MLEGGLPDWSDESAPTCLRLREGHSHNQLGSPHCSSRPLFGGANSEVVPDDKPGPRKAGSIAQAKGHSKALMYPEPEAPLLTVGIRIALPFDHGVTVATLRARGNPSSKLKLRPPNSDSDATCERKCGARRRLRGGRRRIFFDGEESLVGVSGARAVQTFAGAARIVSKRRNVVARDIVKEDGSGFAAALGRNDRSETLGCLDRNSARFAGIALVNCRLTQGECVPVSIATRHRGMLPNTCVMA